MLGLARNCASHLPEAFDTIADWRVRGATVRVIIGEDGSTDNTRELVREHAELVDTRGGSGPRLERMARARQKVLEHYTAGERTDVVLVVDLDGSFLSAIELDAIVRARDHLEQPGLFGVSATSHPYYDLLAFESDTVSFAQLSEEMAAAQRRPLTYRRFLERRVYTAQHELDRSDDHLCISAFNGACFYRGSDYAAATYLSEHGAASVCEHMTLNRQLAADGRRILVDHALVVSAPVEHVRSTALRFYARAARRGIGRLSGR